MSTDYYETASTPLTDVNEGTPLPGCCFSWCCPDCERTEVGTYIVPAAAAAPMFLRLVAGHVCAAGPVLERSP